MSRLPDSQPSSGNFVRRASLIGGMGLATLGIALGGPVIRSMHKPQSVWDNPDKAGAELKAALQNNARSQALQDDRTSEQLPEDILLADGQGQGAVDLSTKVHVKVKIKDPFGLGISATVEDQDEYFQAHASRQGRVELYARPDAIALKADKTTSESGQHGWKITATVDRAQFYLQQVGKMTDSRGEDGKPIAARADSLYEAAYIKAAHKAKQTPEAFVNEYGFVDDWAEGALWRACNSEAQDEQSVTGNIKSAIHALVGVATKVLPEASRSEINTLTVMAQSPVDVKFVPQSKESQLLLADQGQQKFMPTTQWLAGSILHTKPANVRFDPAANCAFTPIRTTAP